MLLWMSPGEQGWICYYFLNLLLKTYIIKSLYYSYYYKGIIRSR